MPVVVSNRKKCQVGSWSHGWFVKAEMCCDDNGIPFDLVVFPIASALQRACVADDMRKASLAMPHFNSTIVIILSAYLDGGLRFNTYRNSLRVDWNSTGMSLSAVSVFKSA